MTTHSYCFSAQRDGLENVGSALNSTIKENIKQVDLLEYPELGMDAIWRIEVENFPAFIVIDDKGNDVYDGLE